MKNNLTQSIKQKLIEQSIKKKQEKTASTEGALHLHKAQAGEQQDKSRWTDITSHPDHQKLRILKEGAQMLNVSDPFFRVHEGTAGATSWINGRECINFSSYNYLGLCGHPQLNQAAVEAINRYGTSVSASRIVSGQRPIHQQLEQALAQVYQAEDALVLVSGHATNVTVIGYIMGSRDLILHDELIHNSALMGAQLSGAQRLPYPHCNMTALSELLERHRNSYDRVLILAEGLYSMDGDFPDLPKLIELKKKHHALLMVDEAHSLGVMGAHGLGLAEHFGIAPGEVDIWMGTLSKTLSACGGYIASSANLIELLRHFAPGFLYSVGMPAQVAAPALAALQVMQQEPERVTRLQHNAHYFLEQAKNHRLNTGAAAGFAVIPVITGSSLKAVKASEILFEKGINVQPILYPAVQENQARLRFFISSEHSEEQIDFTIKNLVPLL